MLPGPAEILTGRQQINQPPPPPPPPQGNKGEEECAAQCSQPFLHTPCELNTTGCQAAASGGWPCRPHSGLPPARRRLQPHSVGPTCLAPLEGGPVWGSTHNSIVSDTTGEATIYSTTLFQQQQVASRQHQTTSTRTNNSTQATPFSICQLLHCCHQLQPLRPQDCPAHPRHQGGGRSLQSGVWPILPAEEADQPRSTTCPKPLLASHSRTLNLAASSGRMSSSWARLCSSGRITPSSWLSLLAPR